MEAEEHRKRAKHLRNAAGADDGRTLITHLAKDFATRPASHTGMIVAPEPSRDARTRSVDSALGRQRQGSMPRCRHARRRVGAAFGP